MSKISAFVLASKLLWSPNIEADFSHYIVFSGLESGKYDSYHVTIDTTFFPLEDSRFYAVKAVDSVGNMSDFSIEVQFKEMIMDTVFVADSLRFELVFSRPEIVVDYSALLMEYRFKQGSFTGEWRKLLPIEGDYSISSNGMIIINVKRFREFLNKDLSYAFDFRVSYKDMPSIYASRVIIFKPLENMLLEVIPYY